MPITKSIDIPKAGCFVDFHIGENAMDNFNVIDAADSNDLWFHVDGHSSCHVIADISAIENINRKNIRYIVTQGAVLCKQHSRYSNQKKVTITYARVADVEKTNTPGLVVVQNQKQVVI
jgi:predicted ribosome quality control (RQC) complex YloA/Tae2 family protein